MDLSFLQEKHVSDIQNYLKELGIVLQTRKKQELIKQLTRAIRKYEKYKAKYDIRYTKIKQLGEPGVDGTTFLVLTVEKQSLAMKTFRDTKSAADIKKEAQLQRKAASVGIAPSIFEVNTVLNFIVMDKMDKHLVDVIREQGGEVTKRQQSDILRIYRKLDECKVFHNDSNIQNYMYRENKLFIIDFGISKDIDNTLRKKLKTDKPNMTIMLIALIMKFKEMNCSPSSYSHLLKFVSISNKQKFNL